MINIVIYARYSSQAQTEQSIEGQLRVCHEYAERKGFNVIHEYIDRAMTGTNDNRPEFQEMIKDSSKKEFDFVLVYKLDRFSRSKYDNAIYKHKLQLNNVKVISATEEISNSPEGMLMEGLLEMFAEMYSKDLSQKVKRGIRENILKGLSIGGKPLYGYKIENKKIIINEEQATAVKLIFNEYANGTPKKEIVEKLNNLGYRTNKGTKFKLTSLQQNILSNRKYLGEYKNEYIDSDNYFPQIIDIETFNKVQSKLKHKKQYHSKPKETFYLTGKIYCGQCGSPMIGTSGTSRNKETYLYYGCSNRLKQHECKKSNENKYYIEKQVFTNIKNKILKKANLIADNILKEYEKNINLKTIKEYENKIINIEKQLDNLFSQFTKTNNESFIEKLNKQANDLTEQKENYKKQISKLNIALKIKHSKEDIIYYIQMFIDIDFNNKQHIQRLVNTLINSIYIFDNNIIVYLNIFNENKKISFDLATQDKNVFEHQTDWSTIANLGRTRLRFFISSYMSEANISLSKSRI